MVILFILISDLKLKMKHQPPFAIRLSCSSTFFLAHSDLTEFNVRVSKSFRNLTQLMVVMMLSCPFLLHLGRL